MRREWPDEELVGSWTLVDEDWQLVGNKSGVTRLGFALLLKFVEIEARFPRVADEVPALAVAYVAEQVKVDSAEFASWGGCSRGRSAPPRDPRRPAGRGELELRERAEVSMLALHLLQSALVHINTLLVQTVLEIPEFHDLIGPDERRGLSPLFCSNINPYGRFRLDMDRRLDRTAANPPAPATVESVL